LLFANLVPRLAASLVITAIVFCVPIGPNVLAESGHQSSSQENSDLDPDAMKALNKMGIYSPSIWSIGTNWSDGISPTPLGRNSRNFSWSAAQYFLLLHPGSEIRSPERDSRD
jgi:hypothetical protein